MAASESARMRENGWVVAVHNDYKLHGEAYTFWGFTRGAIFVKGEGKTDSEAIDEASAAASCFPADLDVKALLRRMRAIQEACAHADLHLRGIGGYDVIRSIAMDGAVPPEPSPEHHVRVHVLGDWDARLMVNGYGVCKWDQHTMVTDEANGLEYAYVVAGARREARARPGQAGGPRRVQSAGAHAPRGTQGRGQSGGDACHYAETRACECECDGCSPPGLAASAVANIRAAWLKERAGYEETTRALQEQLANHRREVERLHDLEEATKAFVALCGRICACVVCARPIAECDAGFTRKDACPGSLLRLYAGDTGGATT